MNIEKLIYYSTSSTSSSSLPSSITNQNHTTNSLTTLNSTVTNISNQSIDIDIRSEIFLRHLCPDDIPELKKLCAEWFPVDYPDAWYNDIAANKRFYSLAAVYRNQIIGMIVAEIKLKKTTDREDYAILSRKHSENTQITYILSIGVFKEFRRLGIASLLLDTLISYLKTETDCKAIYLHVLCSNYVAINFYEKRNFQQRIFLPKYYTIKGQLHDGYCYVLYMNNGEPPWTLTDCMNDTMVFIRAYNPCKLTYKFILYLNNWFRNNILHTNTTTKDFYRIS